MIGQDDSDQRDLIFHTKRLVGEKGCSMIINGGGCTNVASSEMVSKLFLVATFHRNSYSLH